MRLMVLFFANNHGKENVIYRLDFKNKTDTSDYYQLFHDYGWEYVGQCFGWIYFRKSADKADSKEDLEIFSDNQSKIDLINHVIKTRFLPIFVIFMCCLVPNFASLMDTSSIVAIACSAFLIVMIILYIYLIVYCGLKLRKLKRKYNIE